MTKKLKIAIDLDNTLINYESMLPFAAREEGIPSSITSKDDIKNYLSLIEDGHNRWLKIQGKLYGELIHQIYPDNPFLLALQTLSQNHQLFLVSHKTRHSLCQRYLLIEEADKWLNRYEMKSKFQEIHYFSTKEEKIDWINQQSFDVIIDDLQDILTKLQTPIKIHFSRNIESPFIALNRWPEIVSLLSLIEDKELFKISHRAFKSGQSVIKVFPRQQERFDREVFFLEQLKSEHGISFPQKIETISPFIKTILKKDLKSLEYLDEKFCQLFLSFIQTVDKSLNINFSATHAIVSSDHYISLIEERFNPEFLKILPLIHSLKDSVFKCKKENLEFSSPSFSFPDFSKNNFMFDGDKIFLTDFESIGNDEPARMLLNAIHHLGHTIKEEEITILSNAFIKQYGVDIKSKVQFLLDLNALDWILIGAKRALLTHDVTLINELNFKIEYMINRRDQGKEYWSWNEDKIYFLYE